jgi:hypothetical protein
MSSYACPNDGEELLLELIQPATKGAVATEAYVCAFCKYRASITVAKTTLKATSAGYVSPIKAASVPITEIKNKNKG